MAVPWTASNRSTKPLERRFVDLSGKSPRSPGGTEYLMMIVGDFSRFSWPYFLKKTFDVPETFSKFLTDICAQGTPSAEELCALG